LLISRLPGVNVRMAKIEMPSRLICQETYEQMYENGSIAQAIRSISQPENYVTVCGIACTSLSFLVGSDRLSKLLPDGMKYVDMYQGVVAALKALGAQNIVMVTPYIIAVHAANVRVIEGSGIKVRKSMHFDCPTDKETDRLDPEYIAECAESLVDPDTDAVFLGCSGMRVCTPGYISSLEARVKVPVVTSIQAFYWHALRAAGVQDTLGEYGTLFEKH